MVNVYIRRKKKILFIYARRKLGFKNQEPSPLPCNDTISLKNQLGEILSVREDSEGGFESDANATKESETKRPNEPLLRVIQQLPTTVCLWKKPRSVRKSNLFDSRRRFPVLISNESLLSVIEQVSSTGWFRRRRRSAKKSTSLASRRKNIIEVSSSDNTEQMDVHLGTSTSVCCEINPKTPIKVDKKSKYTSHSLLCDVQGLLSTGVLEGSLVTYRKDNFELLGILGTSGIYCGCSMCNFEQVASSLKFEKHAGAQSHNQNAHIFLENGKSLYALSKELKNVPLGSLGEVIESKFGYSANKVVYKDWKDNPMMHHNNGGSRNQKQYPDLLYDHQTSLNFPKGRRSTRPVRPPLKPISKANQVSCQLIFSEIDDTDLQRHPAHKKRGVDIQSSKDLYLKESSEITSEDLCKSKIVGISEKSKLSYTAICKKNGNLSSNCTIDRPFSTISHLLTIHLLERILLNYKKDKIEFLRCIKDLGISCGFSWHPLNKVLSSLNFEMRGGTSNMNQKDCFFINKKLALYALVKEVGRVPLGLMPGELIQKIGCQLNNIRFLPWKGSFHKNKINLPTTSCDDGKNQSPHLLLHSRPPTERLMLPASENNLPLPPVNDAKVNFSRQAKKTKKQRDQDFHQLIFELLNDGTKLSYYSHGKEILEGYKFGKNIICRCCNSMFSASKFEAHAGHGKRRKPYHSIYTYGKSLHHIAMFLLLDKSSFDPIKKDLIMAGKAGGNLTVTLRCHNAYNAGERSSSVCSPLNFQFGRVFQAPSNLGSCMFCENGDATLNFGNICDTTMLFCGQCGRMCHVGCLRIHGICDIKERPNPPDSWLCGDKCIKVRADLLNFVQEGPRTIPDSLVTSLLRSTRSTSHEEAQIDFHWQLLSGRFQGDKSKFLLQQATIIFQEAFGAVYKGYRDVLSTMIHGEKGVAEFFQGMFCVVLTVKSTVVSAALLRVFGNHVAELPLAATTKERRGEGFFKILFLRIEEMLSFMKVENLILPADDHSLPMWLENFGFINLSTEEIREYQMNHRILMFENATMLQKPILRSTLDFA